MYMEPIVAAKAVREPRAAALKLGAGLVSFPILTVAMVAYWAATALWLAVAGAGHIARVSIESLTFLGGEIIGH